MNKCFLCNIVFTNENRSIEHIILNSIGGRLKATDLLCAECNLKFGHNSDAELAKQLAFLSAIFLLKRDSGAIPTIRGGKLPNGESYNLVEGIYPVRTKPLFTKEYIGGKLSISLSARNMNEFRAMLVGIKNKYGQLDIDKAIEEAKVIEEHFSQPLKFNMKIGGELAFRSIAKTAVEYYIHTRAEVKSVNHLFEYLKDHEKLSIVKLFSPLNHVCVLEEKEVLHIIHLVGNPNDKLLYCYIEFFGSFSFLVLLSNNYVDSEFTQTYCYDIVSTKEVNKNVKLDVTLDDLKFTRNFSKEEFQAIGSRASRAVKIADTIQTDRWLEIIIHRASVKVFANTEGQTITKDMIQEFSEIVSFEYAKFMVARTKYKDSIV
jgi:hypothetical protein